jgi:hypothetical protein
MVVKFDGLLALVEYQEVINCESVYHLRMFATNKLMVVASNNPQLDLMSYVNSIASGKVQ